MNKYVVEYIGTFFLVFTIFNVVAVPGMTVAPLAIGCVLAALVFAGGHVSGAHYNPAVTLAVALRGKCPKHDILPYMVAQILAAVLAGITVAIFRGRGTPMALDMPVAFVCEFLFTAALAWVVLNVATAESTAGNSFYGVAIGFTVMGGAFAVGDLSGAAFNPAVAVGAAIAGAIRLVDLWLYVVANFAGAATAAVVYRLLDPANQHDLTPATKPEAEVLQANA